MTNKPSVSIIGGGAVGKAVAAYYEGVKIYDKYKPVDSIADAAAADYIFIAVPTPFTPPYQGGERRGGGQDLTEMNDAIANAVKHMKCPAEQVIIIKSTCLPGTTDAYQAKYPSVNFIFNPEFLTEKTAIEDFARPDKQLVGFTQKTEELAREVLKNLPPAPYAKVLPAKVCEMAKYTVNAYYGFKVIFANQIYDFCEKLGIDYDLVHEEVVHDQRIIDSHFDVWHGGFRGYGGKCLPKDIQTLVWFAKEQNVGLSFIETLIEINNKLVTSLQPSPISEREKGEVARQIP